jgi:REP element-mobilizing transposase RayT
MLSKEAAVRVHKYLMEYAESKNIYMKSNYFNADHAHALIDLPTGISIEDVIQLFKGSSSHWINEQKLIPGKFAWGRGYGAFSVSQSNVDDVAKYIANQEEHHRTKSFTGEYSSFIKRYGLQFHKED